MAETYLKLEKLSVGYGTKVVIGDIDLDIHKGEVISLIGPNGAGKSTIMKTLSKQLPIISGRVVLDGEDLNEYSYRDLSKKMAVVLTEKLKTELMTCRDIVSTGRYPYTGKLGVLTEEDDKKVEEAMRKVNAYDLRDKDFTAISDGQRQRVLL
ncbi:MAG: ABC transporter ATP-binding protein, partial [Eubacteriaceae bacterium]|nr:ABC transporter ATP-binding protein [Eubacteriaceae bacterium]